VFDDDLGLRATTGDSTAEQAANGLRRDGEVWMGLYVRAPGDDDRTGHGL